MEAARPLKRKLSASTMATHGSEGDYDRGHQKSPRPPFRPDPLPFDATAFAGISRGPGGYNNDPPHSTSSFSMRPHALSPSNREEAEEVQKKIQQAKDTIRKFHQEFDHQSKHVLRERPTRDEDTLNSTTPRWKSGHHSFAASTGSHNRSSNKRAHLDGDAGVVNGPIGKGLNSRPVHGKSRTV